MKIRYDFVTNSSSSSFLLAFDSREDAIKSVSTQLAWNQDAMSRVVSDIARAEPLTPEQLEERLHDEAENYAYIELTMGHDSWWWSSDKPTFEHNWMKEHPGATYRDMRESPEWKAAEKELMDNFIKDIKEKLGNKPFIIELEYEDHSELGSELEHDIMGDLEGTVESFNHH